MVNLIDGDYELIPADFITLESASANYTDLNQDLGQVPEDPKVPIIFQYMQYMLYYYLFVHLRSGVGWNLRCMILGSYDLLPGYID